MAKTDSIARILALAGGSSSGSSKIEKAELTETVVAKLAVGNIKAGETIGIGTTFTDFVKKLLIKEIIPSITMSSQGSGLNLKGTTLTNPKTTVNITRGSGTLQKIEFYKDGVLEDQYDCDEVTNQYIFYATNITSDATVQVKLYYTESDGTKTGVVTASKQYKFMNYSYSGVSNIIPALESDITSLSTNLKDTKGATLTVSPNDQYIVYAYPASLGNLSSIKDANNFEYIGSYTKITMTISGESYNVYYLTDKVTGDNIKQIYS